MVTNKSGLKTFFYTPDLAAVTVYEILSEMFLKSYFNQ